MKNSSEDDSYWRDTDYVLPLWARQKIFDTTKFYLRIQTGMVAAVGAYGLYLLYLCIRDGIPFPFSVIPTSVAFLGALWIGVPDSEGMASGQTVPERRCPSPAGHLLTPERKNPCISRPNPVSFGKATQKRRNSHDP